MRFPSFSIATLSCVLIGLAMSARADEAAELARGAGRMSLGQGGGTTATVSRALVLGKFAADSSAAALDKAFIEEGKVEPVENTETGGQVWTLAEGGERFVIDRLRLPEAGDYFAVYFSFWIYAPQEIFPEQHLSLYYYAGSLGKLFVNGVELPPSSVTQPDPNGSGDRRTVDFYRDVGLREGWNHILVKVAGMRNGADNSREEQASLALRVKLDDVDLLSRMFTAPSVAAPAK